MYISSVAESSALNKYIWHQLGLHVLVQSRACICIDRQLEPVVIITCSKSTGNVPTRHHGVHINVMKDSESANVTVRLEVNTV